MVERDESGNIDRYDGERRYCRSLGHHVPFGYCRAVQQGLPCSRIRDCWFETLQIDRFLYEHYTEEQRRRVFAPSKPKLTSILEIAQRAQRAMKSR